MPWATSLNRAIKTVRDTFPTAATITPRGGGSYTLTLIFDEAFVVEHVDSEGMKIMTTEPRATVRLADCTTAPRNYDAVTIGPATYRIARVAPDGSGMAALSLEVV